MRSGVIIEMVDAIPLPHNRHLVVRCGETVPSMAIEGVEIRCFSNAYVNRKRASYLHILHV